MGTPEQGRRWISLLDKDEDIEGRQIGFSIAIDLAAGAVSPKLYAEILDFLPAEFDRGGPAFGLALRNYSTKHEEPTSEFLAEDRPNYVRLITLDDFIKFYAQPCYHYTLSEAAAVRDDFFSGQSRTLEDIDRPWTGGNNRAFVLPWEELKRALASKSGDEIATYLNDALGLGKSNGIGEENKPEFVFVRYPKEFDGIEFRQPAALDIDWGQGRCFYLSWHSSDLWGRTQSCCGRERPFRERIHGPIGELTSEFTTGHSIGFSESVEKDWTALLRAAERRFDKIVPDD